MEKKERGSCSPGKHKVSPTIAQMSGSNLVPLSGYIVNMDYRLNTVSRNIIYKFSNYSKMEPCIVY